MQHLLTASDRPPSSEHARWTELWECLARLAGREAEPRLGGAAEHLHEQ